MADKRPGGDLVLIPAQHFIAANKSYLQDPSFSDFIIRTASGNAYRVHRNIISSHSNYFAKLCRGDFKESTAGEVTLHDDPPEAVKLMIDFFYTFDYKVPGSAISGLPDLEVYAMVFILADKYEIPDLKAHAFHCFEYDGTEAIGNIGDEASEMFLAVVPYIYTHVLPHDHSLRQALIGLWCQDHHLAAKNLHRGEWEGLVERYPAFGSDMIVGSLGKG
ncbi:hypothetical protein LTR85_002255 [Meristemomyces frigidus]|nr:hypothetical protein LTR85_002255 [Meristemomyces frigidus]